LYVIALFEEALASTDYLNDNRIIRCIIFLSDKDVVKFKKNIEAAIMDPPDTLCCG